MICPNCRSENPAGKKFCGECDTLLPGERRQLTIVFSDLVGSTELSTQLDPEEWRDRVALYHRATAAVVTRFGGTVAKYLGDGVLGVSPKISGLPPASPITVRPVWIPMRTEARTLLAEIYGWFTEGFDTKGLQDAKALLEELGT